MCLARAWRFVASVLKVRPQTGPGFVRERKDSHQILRYCSRKSILYLTLPSQKSLNRAKVHSSHEKARKDQDCICVTWRIIIPNSPHVLDSFSQCDDLLFSPSPVCVCLSLLSVERSPIVTLRASIKNGGRLFSIYRSVIGRTALFVLWSAESKYCTGKYKNRFTVELEGAKIECDLAYTFRLYIGNVAKLCLPSMPN